MSARYLPALVVLLGLLVGFVHAAVTIPEPAPVVRCFEDGSCTDGWCEPGAPCDDSSETRP